MTKFSKTDDGRTMFWCKGCESFHWISDNWNISGQGETFTVTPSILVNGGRIGFRCHSYIRNGKIEYLLDCDHDLAGKIIDLPDLELINGDFYSIKELK